MISRDLRITKHLDLRMPLDLDLDFKVLRRCQRARDQTQRLRFIQENDRSLPVLFTVTIHGSPHSFLPFRRTTSSAAFGGKRHIAAPASHWLGSRNCSKTQHESGLSFVYNLIRKLPIPHAIPGNQEVQFWRFHRAFVRRFF